MIHRALLLALAFSLAGILAAGDARPDATPALPELRSIMVDASRSNRDPATLDRIRFVADVLLPLAGPREVWVFDSGARLTNDLGKEVFKERYSDYLALFDAAVRPLAQGRNGALAILAGDGQIEVVTTALPDGYKPFAAGRATREAINNAVATELVKRHQATVESPRLRWLLLNTEDSAPDAAPPQSVLTWIAGRRSDARMLSLPRLRLADLLAALEVAGVRLPGERLGGGVRTVSGPGRIVVALPEGSTSARILLHAAGTDGSYAARLLDPTGHALPISGPSGLRQAVLDDTGVARAWQIDGCEAGASLTLELAGPAQAYEYAVLIDNVIRHRMAAAPQEGTHGLFCGDTIVIRHSWLRAPGDTPVSAALRNELESAAALLVGTSEIRPIGSLTLPAQAGTAECRLAIAVPWTGRVRSQPLTLTWTLPQPLVLAGGFTVPRLVEGNTAQLVFVRSGGRRTLTGTSVRVSGPPGSTARTVALQAKPDAPTRLTGSLPFTAADRGDWTIDAAAPLAGRQENGRIATSDGTYHRLAVVRDWLPLILGLLALLLVLLGLWLWWYLTRPRLRNEVLLSGPDFHRLDNARGPLRASSYGAPDFARRVVLRATRGGLIVDRLSPGVQVLVNAREVQVGAVLQPGNDIEVRSPDGNAHGRLFTDEAQGAAWTVEKAQIDPRSFPSELVVLES